MNIRSEQSNYELETQLQRVLTACEAGTAEDQQSSNASSLNSDMAPRDSVLRDIHEELHGIIKQQQKPPQNNSLCEHCISTLKTPLAPPETDQIQLGYEQPIHFLRAVMWLKNDTLTLKKIPVKNIRDIYKHITGLWNQESFGDDNCMTKETGVQETMTEVQQNLADELNSLIPGNNDKTLVTDKHKQQTKQYLIPALDEAASQISNPISFGSESGLYDYSSSKLTHNSIASSINQLAIKSTVQPSIPTVPDETQYNDDPVGNKAKETDKTVPSMFVSATLDHLQVNNLAFNMIRVILSVFEDIKLAQYYSKGLVSVTTAAKTIVDFIDQVETEEEMFMSTNLTNFFTQEVMNTIKKVFDSLPNKKLTVI